MGAEGRFGCSYTPCTERFDTLAEINRHAAAEHQEEKKARKAAKQAAQAPGNPPRSRRPSSAPATPPPSPADDGLDQPRQERPAEIAPRTGTDEKPGWRGRLWGRKNDPAAPPTVAKATRERTPTTKKPRKARVSTGKLLGQMWTGGGMALARTNIDGPVGRVMMFQGPAAGDVLEGLTKGTPLDRPLQYLAGRAEEVEAARDLFELPTLVFLYERANEDMAAMLEPMLRNAIKRNFAAMVPIVRKAKEDEAKWRNAVAELGLQGDDPVGDLLREIFASAVEPEGAQV